MTQPKRLGNNPQVFKTKPKIFGAQTKSLEQKQTKGTYRNREVLATVFALKPSFCEAQI